MKIEECEKCDFLTKENQNINHCTNKQIIFDKYNSYSKQKNYTLKEIPKSIWIGYIKECQNSKLKLF